jgi:hypothetical protein
MTYISAVSGCAPNCVPGRPVCCLHAVALFTPGWSSSDLERSSAVHELGRLVFFGLDEKSVDRLFAQCLACFEAMQPMDKDEAITITPNEDGCLLSYF